MGTLKNKIVWITGGGSGLGKAMALEFAEQGAKIALSGRRLDRLEEVAEALKQKGSEAIAVQCDVCDFSTLNQAIKEIKEQFGGLDIAVANAGFAVGGRIESLTEAEWRRQLDVNVVGLAQTVRAALPHLAERKGSVVLIGSIASYLGAEKSGAYCASKAAVHSIGLTLSLELKGTGVNCTTIHPGFVESEIAQVNNEGIYNPEAEDKRPMKLMWKADKAAKVMVKAVRSKKRIFIFTGHGKFGAFMGKHFPSITLLIQGWGKGKRKRQIQMLE